MIDSKTFGVYFRQQLIIEQKNYEEALKADKEFEHLKLIRLRIKKLQLMLSVEKEQFTPKTTDDN